MVKLNPSLLRYLSEDDFRVLLAIELCMRNHDVAPLPLIEQVAKLPRGGVDKRIKELLRCELIYRDRKLYEGYSLKYSGYDYLALHTFVSRAVLFSFGHAVACGKESDVYLASDADNNVLIVKLERLGRCSFRSVVRNRNYLKRTKKGGASWFYLSRLAALREFNFMKALYNEGFSVPKAIDHNRHAIVMERIQGTVLCHTTQLQDSSRTFHECIDMIVEFAESGLIHCDFNEFNLMITQDCEKVVVIDFPQMVSTKHPNAEDLFQRDVECVHSFFKKCFGLTFDRRPVLQDICQKNDLYLAIMKGDWKSEHERDFFDLMNENLEEDSQTSESVDNIAAEPVDDGSSLLNSTTKSLRSISINPTDIRKQLKKEERKKTLKSIKKK